MQIQWETPDSLGTLTSLIQNTLNNRLDFEFLTPHCLFSIYDILWGSDEE